MKKTIVAALVALQVITAIAQETKKVHIGDKAPALSYGKWLKGEPIQEYKKDHVYVFEFWATWCGPCIAAMPHLSDLADQYKEKATFIGVNIWEKVKDEPYESSYPAVERFVEHSEDRMRYSVVLDNNAQDMANNWMIASGQGGIPSTFIVKDSIVQWIGHPIHIDSVINEIIDGSFDVAKFKQKFEENAARSAAHYAKISAVFKNIRGLAEEKKTEEALIAIEQAKKEHPHMAMIFSEQKFNIIYEHVGEQAGLAFADSLVSENPDAGISLASTILEKDGGSAEAYHKAATYLIEQDYQTSAISDLISKAFEKAGNKEKATEYAQQAVSRAKSEINQEEFAGQVFPYTVEEYERRLKLLQQ